MAATTTTTTMTTTTTAAAAAAVAVATTGDAPPNGKHVRSHSLKCFPSVAAAVIDGNKKPGDGGGGGVGGDSHTPNSPAKSTSTWKQACDRTKDRTKQLLRRTMSWKSNTIIMQPEEIKPDDLSNTWEIHVWEMLENLIGVSEFRPVTVKAFEFWPGAFIFEFRHEGETIATEFRPIASWMKRYASEDDSKTLDIPFKLSALQEEKFLNFFKYYLDGDCDGFVFEHDFHQFAEKLRRFADWSPSSDEYIILKQVLSELIQVFIPCETGQNVAFISLSTDDWLKIWCRTLSDCAVAPDMPLWLKYFQNILFKSLDSGKGKIEKANLQRFYSTFLDANCEEAKQVVVDTIYNSLTSNGDFRLDRDTWGQCFANWLLGTKPNGCGQWLFGKCGPTPEFFPIDYSAMNSTANTRDTYSHKRRSDRHSIMV